MKIKNKIFVTVLLLSVFSCSSSKKSTTNVSNADGSSFQNAIVVSSVSEEYAYVRKVCPECKFKKQTLGSKGNKYYDLVFFDKAGAEIVYYFDINSFFGKTL